VFGRRRRELAAIARQGSLIARGLLRQPAPIDAARVAVFVHGYLAAGPVFDPLRERVEAELEMPTLDFTYGPFGRFESVLDRFVEHVEAHVSADATISLVGHSLGGILARAFVHERSGGARVDRVLTIATPHAGTTSVRLLPAGPATALRPSSPVLERLARRHAERPDVRHVAIIAGADRLCNPPESAGALSGAEVHRFEGVGHNEIIFDARVHDVITRHLR
jgi:pimeloyl-ACP methyl ester carboxylesterase